jgi:vitamin B12 transporter
MQVLSFPALLAGVFLTVLPVAGAARNASPTDDLDPIVVTATLGPKTIGESLSSVTEISQQEIARKQPRELSDLLQTRPGVSVQTGGGIGQQTSVYLRGHESDATVLLVNGIRIRSATAGIPAWEFVRPELVNRVEVIRGGRSSLYGADAMGGVVQVFTTPREQGRTGWVESGAGNLETWKAGAGLSLVDDNSSLNAGFSRFRTDGSPVIESGEDKAYDNTSGTFNASHELANGVRLNLTYFGSEGNVEYEGGEKDYVFQAAGAGFEVPVNEYWRTVWQFSDARDEQTYKSEFGDTDLNTNTRTSRLENWFVAGVHEFVLGAETMTDQITGSTTYLENSRRNDAFFGQALFNFGPTELHLSGRTDDNEAFGSHQTWGAALGYRFGKGYRFIANAGTSFKAPTFNDLYSPWGGANPHLEPEESRSYELALEKKHAYWFWRVAVYHSEVDNLIVSFFPEPSQNTDQAELQGIELESGWSWEDWSVKAAVSAGDFEDKQTGRPLPFRAEQAAMLDFEKDFQRFYLGTTIHAENHKFESDGVQRIPGFVTWDLRAGTTLAEQLHLKLTVNNMLDKEKRLREYSEGISYITPGRTFMASVRYDFQL